MVLHNRDDGGRLVLLNTVIVSVVKFDCYGNVTTHTSRGLARLTAKTLFERKTTIAAKVMPCNAVRMLEIVKMKKKTK